MRGDGAIRSSPKANRPRRHAGRNHIKTRSTYRNRIPNPRGFPTSNRSGRSSDWPGFRSLPDLRKVSGKDVRNDRRASQQRDCSGFPPDSLFTRSPVGRGRHRIYGKDRDSFGFPRRTADFFAKKTLLPLPEGRRKPVRHKIATLSVCGFERKSLLL